jgi:hypothetical protein
MFNNEFDRGEQFRHIVSTLAAEAAAHDAGGHA